MGGRRDADVVAWVAVAAAWALMVAVILRHEVPFLREGPPQNSPPIEVAVPGDSAVTLVLLTGVRPGMWAAHRDSLDWRTYLTATPRPDSVVVRVVLPDTAGTFVLYYTERD